MWLWPWSLIGLCTSFQIPDSDKHQKVLNSGLDITEPSSPFDEAFRELVNKTLDLWNVPGLSIGVVDGGNSWAQGYGIATIESSTPAEASTLYLVGSTTKAFIAGAMSLLVDDKDRYPQIQWTTPISQLIREDFVLPDEYITTHATVEDALSHRTGMPRHDYSYGGLYNGHAMSSKDVIRSLRHLPLTAEFRTKWQYCNLMYVVISYVIELVTGAQLEHVIETRILRPLGMKSTYFSTTAAHHAPEHLATGYSFSNGSFHEVPEFNLTSVRGAGFMISNVLDYNTWIKSLIDQSPPLSKAGHQAMRTSRMLTNDALGETPYTGPTAYSLGWEIGVYKGKQWLQHSGRMEAYGANVIFFPEIQFGLVSFANTAGSGNFAEEALMWHLIDEKLGVPQEERFDWNKKNRKAWEQAAHFPSTAKKEFYPSVPSPPLPTTLPLEDYEGTYAHPAYHNMTVVLDPHTNRLRIDRLHQTWAMRMELEQVSGEFFIAYFDSTTAPDTPGFKTALPAEFRFGKEGRPVAFGARLEPEMGDEKIWFERIGGTH